MTAPLDPLVVQARAHLQPSLATRELFFAPDVPALRERRLRAVHAAHLPPREPLLVVYDATVFGSAEEGFAITPERVLWKNFFQRPHQVPFRDLDTTTILPLRDGVSVAGGFIATSGIAIGGLIRLLGAFSERAAALAADGGPYRSAATPELRARARVVSTARRWLGEVDRVHYHPTIPRAKIANARGAHDRSFPPDEAIAVLYDDTVFDTGREGFALTATAIFWKNPWEPPFSFAWDDVAAEDVGLRGHVVDIAGFQINISAGVTFATKVAGLFRELARATRERSIDGS